MTLLSQSLKLDSKLGAAFLGNLFAGIFYGITSLQTFIYYTRKYKDPRSFKAIIYLLWLLDSIHLALVTHALYNYMITNYGNPVSLISPTWSVLAQVYATCLIDLIIRGIYGKRVWIMTKRNLILAISIASASILTFVTGMAFSSKAFIERTFENFAKISFLLYTSLGSGVIADILIACSLCVSLSRNRTGFQKTDTLVNTLMVYAINSSVLTTICSIACFITYTVWPHEFTFIGIYFCLSKLYLNSLLATLNGRRWLREQPTDISIALSDSRPRVHRSSKAAYASDPVGLCDDKESAISTSQALTRS